MSRGSFGPLTGRSGRHVENEPVPIWINETETERAFEIGRRRFQSAVDKGWVDYLNEPSLKNHQMGAAGELAASKYLGTEWDEGVDTLNVPDIAPHWQVRWSRYPSAKVKDTDHDDWLVIAVSAGDFPVDGLMRRFYIHGWISVREARKRRDDWTRDPNKKGKPAIFVPYRFLKSP